MRRGFRHLATAAIGLTAAFFLRASILEERKTLALDPEVASGEASGMKEALAERQIVLLSAGLGLFRVLAIDLLWLRAIHVQERGDYFEAGAISRLITGLQPRFPEVWRFQAHNLAYNIPPSFPPGERYPWVLRAIQLLRDDALLYNPESAEIHLDLAFLFEHKLGRDFDDAGFLYRSHLASAFETAPASPREREARREWNLDPERVKALEERYGPRLDFRAPGLHALYWAEKGLAARGRTGAWTRRRLEIVRGDALGQLLEGGRPVKGLVGGLYAFVPDLRFLGPVEAALQEDLERLGAGTDPDRGEERLEILSTFHASVAIDLYLIGDEVGANARFRQARAPGNLLAPSLEDLLAGWITRDGQKPAPEAIADSLDAALLLEKTPEQALSKGFASLARLLRERAARPDGVAAPAVEDLLRAAQERRERGEKLRELPFHLELLDAARREAGPR